MAAAVPNPVQPQILWAIPVPPQPFPNRGYYDFYLNLLSDETVARDFLLANNVLPNTKRCIAKYKEMSLHADKSSASHDGSEAMCCFCKQQV